MIELETLFIILVLVVIFQPIAYGLVTFYFVNKMLQRLDMFNALLQQSVVDKTGLQDIVNDTEHSLDYVSREVAKMYESYAKISFIHEWIKQLDSKITLLNINISEVIDTMRQKSQND